MQLFYNPDLDANTRQFSFEKTESRHIVKSLRKKEGDTIMITNGRGQLFTSIILNANDKRCSVEIDKVTTHYKPWNYYLHMAVAPTKLNDRFEWFLEKATEIGVDEITPILCEHSERKVVKMERLEKIIHSAAKQSLKYHFPKLNPVIKLKAFMESEYNGSLFIAHCAKTERKPLKKSIIPGANTTILIGPEGDFSTNEIILSKKFNYFPVSLGESRLRTETAGVLAVHTVSIMHD